MAVTSYTDYLRDLKKTIDRIRDRPFEYDTAVIQLALCKNGFGYKSFDLLCKGRLHSEYHMGPLNVENWSPDFAELGRTEIEKFFQFPVIYAYSDQALRGKKNPLSTAHWDATVGIVEIQVHQRGHSPKRQRMLFAGFNDYIHAEFFLAVNHDLIVQDHQPGTDLFEWQEDTTSDIDALNLTISTKDHSERLHALAGPRKRPGSSVHPIDIF